MQEDEIIFHEDNDWGTVLLNRPGALNALNLNMVRRLSKQLVQWERLSSLKGVIIEGKGRAFCAGGDIRSLLEAVKRRNHSLIEGFFREEYLLNRQIHLYPKFYVALLDGIVMGGGAGLSIHGVYRVVTEKTLFAMPETGIGFFPDVGASYFLNRLPGETGMFLALTGSRIGGEDMVYLGLATHYTFSEQVGKLKEALLNCELHEATCSEVEPIISTFSKTPPPAELSRYQDIIDRCFGKESVEEIVDALDAEKEKWATDVRNEILKKSPTSLKITFRLLQEARNLDFDSALRLEYRLSQRIVYGNDYSEGVSAIVIDKNRRPRWSPASLEKVSEKLVDSFFDPLPNGELEF